MVDEMINQGYLKRVFDVPYAHGPFHGIAWHAKKTFTCCYKNISKCFLRYIMLSTILKLVYRRRIMAKFPVSVAD